jgi:hypothetical protein
MAGFHAVLSALHNGKSVRRVDWDPVIRMFVSRDLLMCQCGMSKPWNHTLGWEELTADDWQLTEFPSSQAGLCEDVRATTWAIERNSGSRATLVFADLRKEIRRPKRMTRLGFMCLLTPGALIEEEALGSLFRLWL